MDNALLQGVPSGGGASAARSLLTIFDATVRTFGTRTAIHTDGGSLTYDALAQAAARLTAQLGELGIGPGDRVGVRVPSGSADLYVAILGVLQAGAAYVPVDADDPPARAAVVWEGAGACAVIEADLRITEMAAPACATRPLEPDDDAWVIFTSGSTGAPKGVAVSHRSAAAFVDAEAGLFDVRAEDRVLAGLSVGFDASCEEMWLAWRHGATLVPVPRALVRAGSELGPWLAERRVSVVSTVPTLAAMWDPDDLRSVRLLILGGEACPEPLAWRLAADREVWNTYGPTEATVVSTAARLEIGKPVTIGWPLPGCEIAIVDDRGDAVALGEPGELAIGGAGVARYLDPALDAERFAPIAALDCDRAYRTGDIVRETIDGLHFIGRRDDQVKIGGRRLELGEIEAQLRSVRRVRAAAAAVHKTPSGNPILVGYIVGQADPDEVRAALAERLPSGIVPLVVTLDALPTSSSGKVDRKALPWLPPAASFAETGEQLTGTAAWLAERWSEQLGPAAMTPDSDFFALGGSSLAAAKLVSVLRDSHPAVAVSDVYELRTLGRMADRLDELAAPTSAPVAELAEPRAPLRFGLLQLLGVVVLLGLSSPAYLLGALAYGNLVALGTPHVSWAWLALGWLVLASPPAHTGIYVLARHVLVRRLAPGRYSRYSWLAWRLWFIERLAKVSHLDRLGGTPWVDRYARLIRADVGEGARLATVPPAGALLHIGAGASVEAGVDMHGWWIDGQELVVGEITIGAGARVGSRSLLNPGTVIGEGAEIEPGSVVSGHVPAGEHWGGAPARYIGPAGGGWPSEPPAPVRHPRFWQAMFAVGMAAEAALSLASLAPAVVLMDWTAGALPTLHSPLLALAEDGALLVAVSTPVFALLVALAIRLVWKLVRPGCHADNGAVGWALWFGEDLKEMASTVLFPLYASLFTPSWLRLMGLQIGRRSEISVSTGLNPLVRLGELTQATDDVGFCGASARGGALLVEPITVGRRTFLGPGAVLRGGTELGEDSLVGVLTLAPRRPQSATSWFGVPPLELPRVRDCATAERTTDPPARLVVARAAMDLLRLFGPNTISVFIGIGEILALVWLIRGLGLAAAIALTPVVMLAGGLVATAVTVALKWLVIGRYRAGTHPLWSFFVWRDELMNAAQEQLAGEALLELAQGTPLMSLYMRAMGSRVGRGVSCDTLAVTEYDMIELGDGAVVNREACLMTHLFHDRLLRIGPTRIGAGATLGPTAAVLPETTVGAGTTVGGHSVVLRGEELPAGTRWEGSPVRAV